MLNLLAAADRYFQTMNWQKFSLVKICAIAFGVAVGTAVPEKHKKPVFYATLVAFVLTYVPIMADFYNSAKKVDEEMYL